ncbi:MULTISPECIES: ABC transporter ATP-binding protein [unclassified Lysobacter]|uniref:ABC transporter ATP-binding protein n=1 Tax=unclassified Lysobacter TaxID=2635362 RepID=UPI0006F61175|nr:MULTISPECIES: ABC transporter ATP-binding protein [unclassified Lysobacter]KRC35191.1 ABC transporter ATP-binding protein [Lysobacter sp. Root76]KRD70880.1 ABC transporter ATP-binding protein [Lysobacter sp. Root96]
MTEIETQVAPDAADEREIAIRVESVSKCYQVYGRPEDRLKQSIMPRLQRLAGRAPRAYFKEFWALRDVSLEIRRGETVGIIGRNGSGKSTLLQTICGTLTPTSGSIDVNGRVAALLELGAGFNPEFTGRENVYMNGAVLGLTREQIDQRFDDIVAFADIGDFIEQPVKTYSSGMYVRLAFAVIAHADADILVIDEALSVGDVFFGQKCMRFLRKFQETGTVIFVSHDATAVTSLCERAILMESGHLRMSGDAKTVCEAYHASTYDQTVRPAAVARRVVAPEPVRPDFRIERINESALRNDIEVFKFDPNRAGFGNGAASIASVRLTDTEGHTMPWVVGGEVVRLEVEIDVNRDLTQPIVGFFVKDRLGQPLFGDNTYLSYQHQPVGVTAGESLSAVFEFAMPILPQGHYSFDIAVADGTYIEHEQADWIHDGLVVESHTSSVSTGLVGIPFRSIRLQARKGAA